MCVSLLSTSNLNSFCWYEDSNQTMIINKEREITKKKNF